MTGQSQEALPLDEERRLVEELTRATMAAELPEELDVFEAGRDAYLDARGTVPRSSSARDEATGFGAEIVVLLTPYIVAGALAAVKFLAGLVGDAIKEEAKPQVGSLIRRLFRPKGDGGAAEADVLPPLPADTLARVNAVVRDVCGQLDLAEDDARFVADAVTGRLALPSAH